MSKISSFKYFEISQVPVTLAGVTFNYPVAVPNGAGATGSGYSIGGSNRNSNYIDVVNTLPWRNKIGGATGEVPGLFLTEFNLPFGAWTQNISSLLTNAANLIAPQNDSKSTDPYAILYQGTDNLGGVPNCFSYYVPYILPSGSSIRGEINNKWEPQSTSLGALDKTSVVKSGRRFAENVGGAIAQFTTPGASYEKTYVYNETGPKSVTTTFPLYNTLDTDSAIGNFSFVTLLQFQNLKTRTTYATYVPPKIYKVQSTGIGGVYMPAAYISRLDIKSIGTTRIIDANDLNIGNGYNGTLIPEAYRVSITFTELVPESANVMNGAIGGDPVQVIQTGAVGYQSGLNILNK